MILREFTEKPKIEKYPSFQVISTNGLTAKRTVVNEELLKRNIAKMHNIPRIFLTSLKWIKLPKIKAGTTNMINRRRKIISSCFIRLSELFILSSYGNLLLFNNLIIFLIEKKLDFCIYSLNLRCYFFCRSLKSRS